MYTYEAPEVQTVNFLAAEQMASWKTDDPIGDLGNTYTSVQEGVEEWFNPNP